MKKFIITFIIGIILVGSLTGCSSNKDNKTDALKFKEEYEKLNKKKNKDDEFYRTLKIKKSNNIVYKSAEEIVEMMDDKEDFVVYFGFASCPWCRSVVPQLLEVADDLGIYPIYYVDVEDIRDVMVVDEENVAVVSKQGTDAYYELLSRMDAILDDYTLTNEDGSERFTGEKRIYAPNIVSVLDGVAVKLTDGISDSQDDANAKLTNEMKEESYEKIKCSIECLVNKDKVCSSKDKC